MSSTQDPTETGIAVLADVNTTLNASTWRVNGVALSENSVTMGGSKRRRIWPEETLREAAGLLDDRPIVKNFHDLQGNANADDVIGRITNTGYQDGVGIVFEGEISDESIARKVGNDFLEVSAVPGIASEQYDERRDAYVVEEISGFRDIAVVPDGADRGNEIAIGERPAMAALSREALAQSWEVLQETTVSDPEYNGYDSQEWERPSFEGDGRLGFGGDMDAARDSATLIRNGGEEFGDLSLFVVDGNNRLNLNALDSAWQMASSTDDVSSDELAQLRSMYEGLAEQARDAGEMPDDMWSAWQDRIDGEDSEANAQPPETGLRAALEHELGLTGTTPDRCKTIKDGAMTINLSSSRAARDALGVGDDTGPNMALSDHEKASAHTLLGGDGDEDDTPDSGPRAAFGMSDSSEMEMSMSGHEQSSARALLGFDGSDEEDTSWTVTRTQQFDTDDSGTVDLEEDSLARQALSLGRGTDSDALQDGRTPRPDDAVRWESDAGGEREPDEWRYGVVVDGLQDDDDDVVLVSIYESTPDGDGWQNRTDDEERMNVETLEVVGTNGVASLPPVSQVM